jgi:hypothetical protein
MSKERNSTPPQKPSGQPTNNPGGNGELVKGQVPTMRNPPPPPPKKD